MRGSLAPVALALAVAAASLPSGCAMKYKEEEAAVKQKPIDCATAEGDLRILASEKAHVAQQIAMGVSAIAPAGIVLGILTMTERTKLEVATGEYNKMIDQKMAAIRTQCGVQ